MNKASKEDVQNLRNEFVKRKKALWRMSHQTSDGDFYDGKNDAFWKAEEFLEKRPNGFNEDTVELYYFNRMKNPSEIECMSAAYRKGWAEGAEEAAKMMREKLQEV